jgi:hypothetical protein
MESVILLLLFILVVKELYWMTTAPLFSLLPSSFFTLNPFYQEAVASSSAFELQEITNENRQWVQTYGNNDENLKSNYTDILAVNYISDGKYLNVTMWLASGFENNSTSPPNITNHSERLVMEC